MDFGFAGPTEGEDGSGVHKTRLGTVCNMAPEMFKKESYSGQVVDLFATAIVMFTLRSQHPPFLKASASDFHYKHVYANRTDIFWELHEQGKYSDYYS